MRSAGLSFFIDFKKPLNYVILINARLYTGSDYA